ncbi:FecR family protein [Sphingobacterium tabacisoli]|uniref:FecR family protein n=1 Tax=Sphingobacterium tabacisoli TaxID=2044855 RepID=A0ABW5L2B3_9SPHI|nr:FecR family protein [Sphingobacterium tabacisoli]
MDSRSEIHSLVQAFSNNTITEADFYRLLDLVADLDDDTLQSYFLENRSTRLKYEIEFQAHRMQYVQDKLNKKVDAWEEENGRQIKNERPFIKLHPFAWSSIAAALLLFFGVGYYLLQQMNPQQQTLTSDLEHILPGSNKAFIKIGDETLNLDSDKNALTIGSNGLAYDDGSLLQGGTLSKEQKITIQIPRGGQYHLILSDGTRVWLNSDSELSYYPFEGKSSREVFLKGEGYFEVAHLNAKPFSVHLGKEKITVLGTRFNVSNYSDAVATVATLAEGVIAFTSSSGTEKLTPNQQLSFFHKTQETNVKQVDVSGALAWKNGVFDFEGDSFEANLAKIARWYDIDIKCDKGVSDVELGGRMSRGVRLSTFVNYLKTNFGLHCELNNNRVLIIKN